MKLFLVFPCINVFVKRFAQKKKYPDSETSFVALDIYNYAGNLSHGDARLLVYKPFETLENAKDKLPLSGESIGRFQDVSDASQKHPSCILNRH